VFAEIAGGTGRDPAELLASGGHPEIPSDLVAEALVSYADTAPVEVAAHLAPFVTVHSPLARSLDAAAPDSAEPTPGSEPGWGLDLLASVPDLAWAAGEPAFDGPDVAGVLVPAATGADLDLDVDFGEGADLATTLDDAGLDDAGLDDAGLDDAGLDDAGRGESALDFEDVVPVESGGVMVEVGEPQPDEPALGPDEALEG
jgi:hypothetical protein